jgi:hypothetical protein
MHNNKILFVQNKNAPIKLEVRKKLKLLEKINVGSEIESGSGFESRSEIT